MDNKNYPMQVLTAALQYEKLGWSVIPYQPKSKKPLIKWSEYQQRRASPQEIKEWFAKYPKANIGIVTGKISNLVVIDIDNNPEYLKTTFEKLPACPTVKSGGDGDKYHFYFQYPKDKNNIPSRPSDYFSGVELKADGGCITAPPSIHEATGRSYIWKSDPWNTPLPILPEEVLVTQPIEYPAYDEPLEAITEGQRHIKILSIAGSLRRQGLDEESVFNALQVINQSKCSPPLPNSEIRGIAKSVVKYPSVNYAQKDKMFFTSREGGVLADKSLPQSQSAITFQAEDVKKERTGYHGRITISIGEIIIGDDYINLSKSEQRNRTSKYIYGRFPVAQKHNYTIDAFQKDFDFFCREAPTKQVDSLRSCPMDISAPIITIKPILAPYIYHNSGTILFGREGQGKSYAAFAMAMAVNYGITNLWQVNQCPVMIVNLERPDYTVNNRLIALSKIMQVKEKLIQDILVMHKRGSSLTMLKPAIERDIKEYGIKLLILDSLSRAGHGDLNENLPTNIVIDLLNSFNIAWLAIAHSSKGDDKQVFGSVFHQAGADVVIRLLGTFEEENNKIGINLQIIKANEIKKGFPQAFALEFDDQQLIAFRKAHPNEFVELDINVISSVKQKTYSYLKSVGKATATEVAVAIGHSRKQVLKIFEDDKFVRLPQKEGTKVFFSIKYDD